MNSESAVLAAEKVRALAARFVTRLPERLESLESALANADHDALLRLFHALAGTAGTYHVDDIAALAAEGERVSSDLEKSRAIVEALARAIERQHAGLVGHSVH